MTITLNTDDSLLELAEMALEQAAYSVTSIDSDGLTVLAAEDENNVIVVAALVSPEELLQAEPIVSRTLTSRLADHEVGGKKWDAYVVLLCAQPATDELTEALSMLTANLRLVRRLIRVGVKPTKADVTRALRPLLPLPEPAAAEGVSNPLDMLRTRLLEDGIDEGAVRRAMDAFRLSEGIGVVEADSEIEVTENE